MIIDDNGNNLKYIANNNELNVPKKLHSNDGIISPENNLLTKELSTFVHTNPTDNQTMSDKAVAMLHERYKNRLMNSENFNKKCTNIAKNRQ